MNVALIYNLKPVIEKNSAINNSLKNEKNIQINLLEEKYAEWDSEETIFAVKNSLEKFHKVELIEANLDIFKKLEAYKPDIVFNIAEGLYGKTREAQVPAILEYMNIPYTGSDSSTLSICLEKSRAKEILSYYKINTPKFFVANKKVNELENDLTFPLIVKPNLEGSGKGILKSSFVQNIDELNREIERIVENYNQPALIEEFLPGREFTVAILGNDDTIRVLPIVEILFDDLPEDHIPIYSYETKWIYDTREAELKIHKCPCELDDITLKKIEDICIKAYNILNCRDWTRIDLRLDKNNEPSIIELNPLPGILPDPKDNSCFPTAARVAGMEYDELINTVLNEARMRYDL